MSDSQPQRCEDVRCQLKRGHAGSHWSKYYIGTGRERIEYVDEWGDWSAKLITAVLKDEP